MNLGWFKWIGLLIIIIGFILIGNDTLIIPFGLIIVAGGFFMILVGLKMGKKKPNKVLYICILVLFIIIILMLIMGLFVMSALEVAVDNSVSLRECDEGEEGIMFCDGEGITNSQICEDVCLTNGLIFTQYITDMQVPDKGSFDGCYCYDSDENLKYAYIIT